MSKISICMIVKNEEQLLPRALAHWRDLADELIIVDTGSTDGTLAVAEYFGAKILHYDWQQPGNKGEARNMGIDAATGDWIVVLDADEIIQDPADIRATLLGEQAANVHGLNVWFQNYDEADRVTLRWRQVRIFRRGCYRYCYREHELPFPINPHETVEGTIDSVFEHRPPAGRAPTKNQPMIERLRLDVEEHPGDPHPMYFLHRQYALAGMWDESIEMGARYLDLAYKHGVDVCECYGNLALCWANKGDLQRAAELLHRAAAIQPERKFWWIRLAEVYYDFGKYNIAMGLLRCAAELWPAPEANGVPYHNTVYLYEFMQRCQAALATGVHTHG